MKVTNYQGKEVDCVHFSVAPQYFSLVPERECYVVYGLRIDELPFMMNDETDIDAGGFWEPIATFHFLSSAVVLCNDLNSRLLNDKGDNDG